MPGTIERNTSNLHDADTGEMTGYKNPVTGKEAPLLNASQIAAVANTVPTSEKGAGTALLSISDLSMDPGLNLIITSPYNTGAVGTNTLVHPSVVYIPGGFQGYMYWMAVTPYVLNAGVADDSTENPCIYCSNDSMTWVTPAGLVNPVFPTPGGAGNYNSDTHLYYHTDGYLYMIWRERNTTAAKNRVWGSRSANGSTWEAKTLLLDMALASLDCASPSFWHDGTDWVMTGSDIVDAAFPLKRRTKSGAFLASWDALPLTTITPPHPEVGAKWWHSDIHRLASGRLIGIGCENTAAPGGAAYLWMSDNNGGAWSLVRLTNGQVYRSCLVVKDDSPFALVSWISPDGLSVALRRHPLRFGRKARIRQEVLSAALALYTLNVADRAVIAHADAFLGGAAALAAPWTQNTAVNVNRNGSGAAAAAGVGAAIATVEVGSAEMAIRARFINYTGTGILGVCARYVDANNFIVVGVAAATGKIRLEILNGGVSVVGVNITPSPLAALPGNIRVECEGAIISVFVNDIVVYRELQAYHLGATKGGIYMSGDVLNTLDEFLAYPL